MMITDKEIMDLVLSNNTARITEVLDEFGLSKDGSFSVFTPNNKKLMQITLSTATIAAWRNELDAELARKLIEHTARAVSIFTFMRFVAACLKIDAKKYDYGAIPEEIRKAINENKYSDEIASAIENLDDGIFDVLVAFLSSYELESIGIDFSLPIILHIHDRGLIPMHLLFAGMGLCSRDSIAEHLSHEIIRRVFPLGITMGELS